MIGALSRCGEFVRHSDIGLPSLIEYQNAWARNVQELEQGMLVRYEDLRAEPVPTLLAITKLMGESFSEEEVRGSRRVGFIRKSAKAGNQRHVFAGGA